MLYTMHYTVYTIQCLVYTILDSLYYIMQLYCIQYPVHKYTFL